jgi:hypothetical protein
VIEISQITQRSGERVALLRQRRCNDGNKHKELLELATEFLCVTTGVFHLWLEIAYLPQETFKMSKSLSERWEHQGGHFYFSPIACCCDASHSRR